MDEVTIAPRLLEYIRNEQNNPDISYLTPPKSLANLPETKIYTFQLENTSKTLQDKMVLRIYPEYTYKERARTEEILHNYLADQNYPAPRIHFTTSDQSILGGRFTVMDYVQGETLYHYGKKIAETFAEVSVKLHNIDPEPLQKKLTLAGITESRYTGFSEREQFVKTHNMEWLTPAIRWLKDNRPKPERVICHGDIHASNIMMYGDKISGVLDWTHFCVDDPCRDVGSTLTLYKVVMPCYVPESKFVFELRMDKFLDCYLGLRELDLWKLGYFEALRCFSEMSEIGGRAVVQRERGVLGASADRFTELTGVKLSPK
jgi:aminoglycoside phosphotransferase (APT) family kinase protein